MSCQVWPPEFKRGEGTSPFSIIQRKIRNFRQDFRNDTKACLFSYAVPNDRLQHLRQACEEKTQELVDQEIRAIDWEDVDQYPLFADCDELVSKPEQKKCFMRTLLKHFSKTLTGIRFCVGGRK